MVKAPGADDHTLGKLEPRFIEGLWFGRCHASNARKCHVLVPRAWESEGARWVGGWVRKAGTGSGRRTESLPGTWSTGLLAHSSMVLIHLGKWLLVSSRFAAGTAAAWTKHPTSASWASAWTCARSDR